MDLRTVDPGSALSAHRPAWAGSVDVAELSGKYGLGGHTWAKRDGLSSCFSGPQLTAVLGVLRQVREVHRSAMDPMPEAGRPSPGTVAGVRCLPLLFAFGMLPVFFAWGAVLNSGVGPFLSFLVTFIPYFVVGFYGILRCEKAHVDTPDAIARPFYDAALAAVDKHLRGVNGGSVDDRRGLLWSLAMVERDSRTRNFTYRYSVPVLRVSVVGDPRDAERGSAGEVGDEEEGARGASESEREGVPGDERLTLLRTDPTPFSSTLSRR
jgi:hypothetical protein